MGVSPAVAAPLRAAAQAARTGEPGPAMTHAWLFTGPPGSGRSVAALAFAAALECEHPSIVGCGRCPQCVAVKARTHGDLVFLDPRELSIGKEWVNNTIVKESYSNPTTARWRVVILDNADRLTAEAGNTMLKTFEEPPSQTVIILCAPSTDPDDMLPTLVSRARHLHVPPPSVEDVARILTRDGQISQEDALLAAAATGSHIGRARRLATDPEAQKRRFAILHLAELMYHGDQAFRAVTDIVKSVTKAAEADHAEENEKELEKLRQSLGVGAKGRGVVKMQREYSKEIKVLEELQKKRKTRAIRDALDMSLVDFAGLYRDALMIATGAQVDPIHPDMAPLAGDLAKVGVPGLAQCIDAVMACRTAIATNVRPETALDAMVGKIRLASRLS
ncbi:DNA polymerase III subunit delta' [Corynebacterium sp. SCR221107]|uniref:DNA polymerase III subunit delta' n=1 Tax=Corynebacterium sp. SCR221107 TaxID=3017361 RepID=UPI0022EC5E06|nr:DNA polymerase III subunit delta' [Corynebacterium sp. SCR221107]WBT09964.1 DNA polymerase III subunit delta' [Corynebacterium sp. SCR221107]